MPMLQRPDGEVYHEEFGNGFPILLFAPGGLKSRLEMWHHPAATSDELARLLPSVEVVHQWRGPEHMEDQRLRVTAFLDRHTPK
jgi:hypothetical protein